MQSTRHSSMQDLSFTSTQFFQAKDGIRDNGVTGVQTCALPILLQANGVNRLSVGIQTFSDRGRNILNRTFPKKETIQRLQDLRKAFHGLLCIDIIYNYPAQSDQEVLEDIRIASDLGVDSISFYSLMIQEGSEILKNISKESIEMFYDVKRSEEHTSELQSRQYLVCR